MYSYFISATETEITQMTNLDDVIHHIVKTEPMIGAKISPQAIVSLSRVIQAAPLKPIENRIFLFSDELKEKLANAEYEELLDLSVL